MRIVVREDVADVVPPPPPSLSASSPSLTWTTTALRQTGMSPFDLRRRTILRAARAAALCVVACVLVAGLGVGLLAASGSAEARHGPVAVVFEPWVSESEAVARVRRAGGLAIDADDQALAGVLDRLGVVFAVGDGGAFREGLRREGAWLLFEGDVVHDMF